MKFLKEIEAESKDGIILNEKLYRAVPEHHYKAMLRILRYVAERKVIHEADLEELVD